ncbi:MAG: hypothetical protein ACOYN3_02430 [Acidimicrobiia bacterium]
MRRARFGVGCCVVVAAVGLAACGGSGKSSSSDGQAANTSNSANAANGKDITCSSLNTTAAQAIVGGPIDEPKPASTPSTGCSWYLKTDDLSVHGITALNTSTVVFDGTKRAQASADVQKMFTYESVSGIGDDAFFQMPATPPKSSLVAQAILLVKQGNHAYNISVTKKGASLDEIKAMEKQAARELLQG